MHKTAESQTDAAIFKRILTGIHNLSSLTEQQASSLEETASSIEGKRPAAPPMQRT